MLQLRALQAGQPLAVVPDAFLNLIHVEDVVGVVAAVDETNAAAQVASASTAKPAGNEGPAKAGRPFVKYNSFANY